MVNRTDEIEWGVLLIARGLDITLHALRTAARIRHFHPKWPIVLLTDQKIQFPFWLHQVVQLTDVDHVLKSKVKGLKASPFKKTLYLDCDVWLRQPIPEATLWLDQHDFAIAHAPVVTAPVDGREALAYLRDPEQFDPGIFAFKSGRPWDDFYHLWLKHVEQASDQLCSETNVRQDTLNILLKKCDCPLRVMQVDNVLYNAQKVMMKKIKKSRVMNAVKITHGPFVHSGPFARISLARLKRKALKKVPPLKPQ